MFKKMIKQKYSVYEVRKAYNVEERRGEVRMGFGWGNQRERDHLDDESMDGTITSES
jgi:hypothetical protein